MNPEDGSRMSPDDSVTAAIDAADMHRFIETLFDVMCKCAAEAGTVDFFMVRGIRGSWKSAPAQLFTRIFLDKISPEVFRHACISQLMVNDELYSRPMDLFLVERDEKNWPKTHRLLVHSSTPVGRMRIQENTGHTFVENRNSHRISLRV